VPERLKDLIIVLVALRKFSCACANAPSCVEPCLLFYLAAKDLLPPFQNIGRFGFSRFIYFAMYLDIYIYESRYIAKYMNLEKSKRPTFWNGGSCSHPKYSRFRGLLLGLRPSSFFLP